MPVEQLIFTDAPRGTGVNPNAAGLQVVACSEGVDEEIQTYLHNLCMHHGQAYTSTIAPAAATEAEREWQINTTDRAAIPQDMLARFPIIWSYDRLPDRRYALIRVEYTCLTHDGRTGNIFAHALIFDADALAPLNGDPLALVASNLFLSRRPGEETVLPQIPDFGAVSASPAVLDILRREPYQTHAAQLIASLGTAAPSSRPVLLAIKDWKLSIPLIRAMLAMLPPSARGHITFNTYESDRTWLPPAKTGRSQDLKAAHHIVVMYRDSGRPLGLRPDEYQTNFAAFNFIEERFSDPPSGGIRPWAAFAAEKLAANRPDLLVEYHTLIETLGLAGNIANWDAAVTIAALLDENADASMIQAGTQALTQLPPLNNAQAQNFLTMLDPCVKALAAAADPLPLIALAPGVAHLTDAVGEEAANNTYVEAWGQLAQNALLSGKGRTAAALLQACGKARDKTLAALLSDIVAKNKSIACEQVNMDDREKVMNILLDGLRLVGGAEHTSSETADQLLSFTCVTGGNLGMGTQVWQRIGDTLIKPRLTAPWDSAKTALAERLLRDISAESCPEGRLWLELVSLENTAPEGDALRNKLVNIARTSALGEGNAETIEKIVALVAQHYPKEYDQVIMLALVSEATAGTTVFSTLFEKYATTAASLDDAARKKIQRNLAKDQANQVLCHEMLTAMTPWEQETGETFKIWNNILREYPALRNTFQEQVAQRIRSGQWQENSKLAQKLLQQQTKDTGSGRVALIEAVIGALPLEPSLGPWNEVFGSVAPDNVSPQTNKRLQIIKFMNKVEKLSRQADWSTGVFPHTDPVWQQVVKNLDEQKKRDVLRWCIKTFMVCGITTPDEAYAFAILLNDIDMGMSSHVAGAAMALLTQRDPVTHVLVATAFVQCSLKQNKPDDYWASIVREMLAKFDHNTSRLLLNHLQQRFQPEDEKYQAKLKQFLIVCELVKPEDEAPSGKVGAKKPPQSEDARPEVNLFRGAGRQLRRFMGISGDKSADDK